jgi:hypothetical protein
MLVLSPTGSETSEQTKERDDIENQVKLQVLSLSCATSQPWSVDIIKYEFSDTSNCAVAFVLFVASHYCDTPVT